MISATDPRCIKIW